MSYENHDPGTVKRRARIVQISDLHINAWGERSVLNQLKNLVHSLSPDLLIVSGDLVNHPIPRAMRRASRLIAELRARDSGPAIPALVLPGNHDYKFWGNVGLRRLTRVPFHLYFRETDIDLSRWSARWGKALKRSTQAIWPWSSALKDRLEIHEDPERGLLVVGFNSNTLSEMMAAGKVGDDNLQEFSQRIEQWKGRNEVDGWFKIAVVHHHAAPIPFVKTGTKERIQESFMVLYNAGTLLRALFDAGFQLVLHGHKHFAGFTRLRYANQPDEVRELAVAAAGSAGHDKPDDPRGNQLHVIDLFEDETALLDSHFFDASVSRKDTSLSYVLQDLAYVGRLRRKQLAEKFRLTAAQTLKVVTVTIDGYSEIDLVYQSCRVLPGASKSNHPCFIHVPRPTYLRRVQAISTPRCPKFSDLKGDPQGLRMWKGTFEFGESFQEGSSPFDFGATFRIMNAHTLTPLEFRRHYSETREQWEYSTLQCDLACDGLRSEVLFPEDFPMDDLTFGAEVLYMPYPVSELDDFDAEQVLSHPLEAQRVDSWLRRNGQRLILEVKDPVAGFLYRIRWRVEGGGPSAPEAPLKTRMSVRAGKAHLIDLARGALEDDARSLRSYRKLQEALENMVLFLKQESILLSPGSQEMLDLSLLVFDEVTKRLRFVVINFAHPDTLFDAGFVSGEGCAGFAFEKTRTVFYHPQADQSHYFIQPKEWPDPRSKLIDQACMISVPWVHQDPDGHRVTVGTLNLGSRRPDSELLKAIGKPEGEQEEIAEHLTGLTTKMGSDIFELVKAGT